MNNYCRNCGEKITDQKVCSACGTMVLTKRVGELDKVLAKKLIKRFLILVGVSFVFYFLYILEEKVLDIYRLYLILNPICSSIPYVLFIYIIYAKEKLKYSKFFNFLFYFILFSIILFFLICIFSILSCIYNF